MRIFRDNSSGSALSEGVEHRERLALERESDAELRGEGLLRLAGRLERRGEENAAAELYAGLVSDAALGASLRERAGRRLAVLQGEGRVGDRVERGLRSFAAEASHPAALAAMAVGGFAFRATRLAVLGRMAISPASLATRGWGARSAASLAGYAVEAPLFALSAKVGRQVLGDAQDWSAAGLGRELAASYLFLGALRLSGAAAASVSRGLGQAPGSLGRGLFTQAGMFTGILGAHALEVQAGLAPRRDGTAVLVDSLALLLQFNVAGRLSQRMIGARARAFERELELRSEILSPPAVFSVASRGPDRPFAWSVMVSEAAGPIPTGPGRRLAEMAASASSESRRPSAPKPAGPSPEASSAAQSLRRLLDQARPLGEEAKREVIRRIQAGDLDAQTELIRSDIRWVYRLAKSYGIRGPELLDLLQEGQMGLLEAARRFDFSRDNKFITYANWWVRHYLTSYASKYLQEVRLPAHELDALRHLRQELKDLGRDGEEIDVVRLAEKLEVSPKRLEELRLLARSRYVDRMEERRGPEEGYDLHDILPDKSPLPDAELIGRRLREAVEEFVSSQASEADRFLLENRLFRSGELSFDELARRLGSTRSRVKNRENRLLFQLRVRLEGLGIRSEAAAELRHAAFFKEPPLRSVSAAERGAASSASAQNPEPGPSGRAAGPPWSPRVAIVGFGMAGVGAANALRNARLFSEGAREISPRLTVFEGMNRVGGKVAPENRGAQFLDAAHFYPLDRLIREHGLETTPPREDYDLAAFGHASGKVLPGRQFAQALRILRQAAREALRSRSWEELDGIGAVDFIQDLARRNGPFSVEEAGAMVARLGFEEGALNISTLSFAINLAKSETPMPRFEIVGGLQRLVEAEQAALREAGGEVRLGHPVRGLEAMADGIRLFFEEGGRPREESFDYAILALAPEHLRGFEASGTELPLETLTRLEPAHIRKTNLRSSLASSSEEWATSRFARWNSPDSRHPQRPMVTFFHGMTGESPLSLREMMREAYGREDAEAVLQVTEQVWDGRPQDGIPHYYTTMPQPGAGYPVVRFAMDQYFGGRYDAERLRVANHTLGLGCYVRDGALAGELAALSLLRGAGFELKPAAGRDPRRELIAADEMR